MLKKSLAIMLMLGMLSVMVSGCTKSGEIKESGEDPDQVKIGYVVSTGGLGDNNVNDAVFYAVKDVIKELGEDKVKMDYVECKALSDTEPYLTDFAKNGTYDLVIAVSSGASGTVANVAKLYPDQKFLLVDNPLPGMDNVASLTYDKSQEGFLSGVAAGFFAGMSEIEIDGEMIQLDNSQKVVGAFVGMESPETLESIYGFEAGIKYIDPTVKVLYSQVGSWNDQAKSRELAFAAYDQGAQFVYQNTGASAPGVYTAAKDRNLYTAAWNVVQHTQDPAHILWSAVKEMQRTTTNWILNWIGSGEFKSGDTMYTCEDENIGLYWSESFNVPDEMKEAVNRAWEMLANGELVAPLTQEELDAFDLRYQ